MLDSSTDKRYSIKRKGKYDPYNMIIADLETADSGSYYCCLPSNCSTQIDEDRCQKFALTVNTLTVSTLTVKGRDQC